MIWHPYVIGNQCNVSFQGFETRGTPISARLSAWSNLVDSISHAGPLTANPLEGGRLMSLKEKRPKQKRRRKNGAKKQKQKRGRNRGRKRNDSQVRLVQTLNSGGNLVGWSTSKGTLE